MVSIAFVCFSVPLLLMLPVLRGRSRWLVAALLVGSYLAVCAGALNTMLQQALSTSCLELSLSIAPVVEELLKALPVLAYALLKSDRRADVLAVAFSTGIGFAITENAYLMMSLGADATVGWAFVRGISASLMHGLCTLMVGIGFTFVRTQRKLFFTGTFGLLAAAITYHAAFNLLVSANAPWDAAGLALPLATYAIGFVVWMLKQRKSTPREAGKATR